MLNQFILIISLSLIITGCGEAQFGKLVSQANLDDSTLTDSGFLVSDDSQGENGGSTQVVGDDKDPDEKADEAIVKCDQAIAEGKIIKMTKTIVFPESKECNWAGQAPNSFDNWINKRIEQVETVALDSDLTVCDLEFKSKNQYMKYDDEILLVLGDVVLFSSVDYSEQHRLENQAKYEASIPDIYDETDGLKSVDGLVKYMWDGLNGIIRNKNLATDDPRPEYCLGNSVCEIPDSETEGIIKLAIPQFEILKAAAHSGIKVNEVGSSNIDFKFVTTGDNDFGDCYHEEFQFDVEVSGYKVAK